MISTVFVESTRPAGELPRYCYLMLSTLDGFEWVPFRVQRGERSGLVLATRTDRRGVTLRFQPTDILRARVPESWEDARWDIGFDLMQKGII